MAGHQGRYINCAGSRPPDRSSTPVIVMEVIPAAATRPAPRIDEHPVPLPNLAGDGPRPRNARIGGERSRQDMVLTAAERPLAPVSPEFGGRGREARVSQTGRPDVDADAASRRDMAEIGDEPVADIDHGGGP